MNRRSFLGSLAALLPIGVLGSRRPNGAIPLEPVATEWIDYPSWCATSPRIPIIYGVISDEDMPKPPYYRAHDVVPAFFIDERAHRFELVR